MTFYNRLQLARPKNKKQTPLHNHPHLSKNRISKWNRNRVTSPLRSQSRLLRDKISTLVSAASVNQVWCPNTPPRSETLTMRQVILISYLAVKTSQKVISRPLRKSLFLLNSNSTLNPLQAIVMIKAKALNFATMILLLSAVKTLTKNLHSTITLTFSSSSRGVNWQKKSCIWKWKICFRERPYNSTSTAK